MSTFTLAVVSAGTSDPSSTRLLADRIASRVTALAARRGNTVTVSVVELRELAADIAAALTSQLVTPKLEQAIAILRQADGIVASTPVYKAGPSGLFTSFFHILDNDLLIGKPVVLAATAGTARHALVADDQMRPLFAYLRTLAGPTSVFAAPEDWSDPALAKRADRAAFELVLLMESGFARQIRDESWSSYQHEYGSAGGTETAIDLDTDLMRLAAGGSGRCYRAGLTELALLGAGGRRQDVADRLYQQRHLVGDHVRVAFRAARTARHDPSLIAMTNSSPPSISTRACRASPPRRSARRPASG